jgi:hypothetical protein
VLDVRVFTLEKHQKQEKKSTWTRLERRKNDRQNVPKTRNFQMNVTSVKTWDRFVKVWGWAKAKYPCQTLMNSKTEWNNFRTPNPVFEH